MTFADGLNLTGLVSFVIATLCALRSRRLGRAGWGVPTAIWALASSIFFVGGAL